MRIEVMPGVFSEGPDIKEAKAPKEEKPKGPPLTPEQQSLKDAKAAIAKAGKEAGKKKTSSSCSVCGRPESRDHVHVNAAGPAHKACRDGDVAKKLATLEKGLLIGTIDLARRRQWNAQVEFMKAQIRKARGEHDKWALDQAVIDGKIVGRPGWMMEGALLAARFIIENHIDMQTPEGVTRLTEHMKMATALVHQKK